jgi:hypothetical protein
MIRTLEAIIDEQGNVRLLEAVHLDEARRTLVVVLEERPTARVSDTALLSEVALAKDWNHPREDGAWSHHSRLRG